MVKNDNIDIDLKEIFLLLLKRWYIIALAILIIPTVTYIVSKYYMKPVYRAETTLFLGKEKDKLGALSLQDLQAGSQLLVDYRELFILERQQSL